MERRWEVKSGAGSGAHHSDSHAIQKKKSQKALDLTLLVQIPALLLMSSVNLSKLSNSSSS